MCDSPVQRIGVVGAIWRRHVPERPPPHATVWKAPFMSEKYFGDVLAAAVSKLSEYGSASAAGAGDVAVPLP